MSLITSGHFKANPYVFMVRCYTSMVCAIVLCLCVYVSHTPSTIEMAPQIELIFEYDCTHVSVAFVHH